MKSLLKLVLLPFLLVSASALAVTSDMDYLPKDVSYNPDIPTPESTLGYPVGTWHVRHDQLVSYMRQLADVSPRISIETTGYSHEQRPLLLLKVTAPDNQPKLEQIRQQHIRDVQEGKESDPDQPLVVWMGYSVHGNESSGANAALLVAYYLAAAQGDKIDELLNNTVILLDPTLNPDGLSRFAQWANMHKGNNLVADSNHREHWEAWPNGRTNHYWFDLNRDWLLLTHPESRARIEHFHKWRPAVLTDFHEMGTNSSFFFQPGIPSRKNPWTPDQNVTLTKALADFHAAALDEQKQLYFTQESYDDFYYGKGSTYPDALGSVGILFEQASSRGHLQESIHGDLSFPATIQNQFTTSLSTFEGALANKKVFQQYQQGFKQQTDKLIGDDELAGYVLTESTDKTRFNQLLNILSQHQIQLYTLKKDVKIDDRNIDSSHSVYVPLDQPGYRLIKSIFSERKRFYDNTFYDVSNWNLPLAFNIDYVKVEKGFWRKLSVGEQWQQSAAKAAAALPEDAYAFGFSWQDSNAPALLMQLHKAGVNMKVAQKTFVARTPAGEINFPAGSVLIPAALEQPQQLGKVLQQYSADYKVQIHALTSGLTSQGIDLGSRQMWPLTAPKVLLVGGPGTSQYEAGEIWHYLDTRVGMPVSVVDKSRLGYIDLAKYSHMIFVDGRYGDISDKVAEDIEHWLNAGGVMIGQKGGAKWFSQKNWLDTKFVSDEQLHQAFDTSDLSYADQDALAGKKRIAGAVFETKLDTSHPLAFGFADEYLPMFRNSTLVMEMPDEPFVTVAQYVSKPLIAGYTADELQQQIANSAAVVAHSHGKGKVIAFTTDVNFRGYWYGNSRLLSNALFFGDMISE